ncbi:hypothetical protein [Falsiroseomonas oryziterrae]|uniref:hypothetical protein n=1 Tax=Falsiroseomonas oryziterrae TaxID=2911368 RepID=UPI001F475F76|nr:hypothetical protein [Roseomonas sp. NPKOSM-4]
MTRLLLVLLLLPGLALAQTRAGPDQPALSAQPPPTALPNEAADRTGAEPNRIPDDPPRTAPPGDHRVLGGPPVPGASQPPASEGFATSRDRIPERPGARPDASTTGR